MGTITTRDGTEIFYKDWGSGRPVVFSHGWRRRRHHRGPGRSARRRPVR